MLDEINKVETLPTSYRRGHDPNRHEDDLQPLPSFADEYQAAAPARSKELNRLVLILGRSGFQEGADAYIFLQYVHLGTARLGFTPQGQVITLLLADLEPKRITIRGRNLLKICDYISQRRMQWIRVADRDFRPMDGSGSNEPIITAIEIADWQPEETHP